MPIDGTKKLPVSSQCDWINDNVDEGHEYGTQSQCCPGGVCGEVEREGNEAWCTRRRGTALGKGEEECQCIAREGQKGEGQRIHERDVGQVQFLPHGGFVVVVPPEGDAGAGGGMFADEGGDPGDTEKQACAFPAQQSRSREEKGREKCEHLGTEKNSVDEKDWNTHELGVSVGVEPPHGLLQRHFRWGLRQS